MLLDWSIFKVILISLIRQNPSPLLLPKFLIFVQSLEFYQLMFHATIFDLTLHESQKALKVINFKRVLLASAKLFTKMIEVV